MREPSSRKNSKNKIILANLSILAAVYCTPAYSQSAIPPSPPPALTQMVNCLENTDSNARLACFDSQALIVKSQIDNGDLVPVYKNEIAAAQRGLFGIDRIRMPNFLENSPQDISEISATIASAIRSPVGKWRFILDDESEWEQVDTSNPYFNSKPGTDVRIRRGSLNSYLLTVGNSSAIRVSRRR